MSVYRCKQEVDSREFVDWVAFNRINPIGQERADFQTASIVHAIHHIGLVQRDPTELNDHLLQFSTQREEVEEQTPDQQLMMLMALSGTAPERFRVKDGE